MKVYDSYKPILLPWLTYIPAHWDLQRNKNIFRECKAEVGDNSDQYTLLSLSLKGIIPRDMDGGGKFPASFDKYKIVKKGNMAFCLFDIDETPRTVGLSEFDGMLTCTAETAKAAFDKNSCELHELFGVIKDSLDENGYVLGTNGAQEIEIYNYEAGLFYAYVQVMRKEAHGA